MPFRRRLSVMLAIVAAVAIGCGGDDSEPASAPTLGVGVPDAAVDDEVVTTDTLVPPTPTDPPRPAPPMLGELEVPCGRPGDGADVGIDADRIVIGVGNDRGGLYTPWSGTGVVEAVRSLADRCNSLGGVAGRQIVVEEFDAAVVEVEERMAEACENVFSLVGHAYLLDHVGEPARAGCGLPSFPAWGPGTGDEVDGVVSALTATPVPVPIHGEVAALIVSPSDAGRLALIGPRTAGGAAMRARRVFALLLSELPFEVVADIGYGVEQDPEWKDVVNAARRADAGAVRIDGSCRSVLLPFLRAAADVDWDPAVVAGDGAYDPECIADATDVSFARVLVEMPFLPVSDGADARATTAIAEMFAEVDVPLTGDSLRAASAFWLWATAAEACGAQLDRACVIEEAAAIDEWTAGGLHTVTDPGTSVIEPCVVLLGVDDGEFVRRLPEAAGELDCDALE